MARAGTRHVRGEAEALRVALEAEQVLLLAGRERAEPVAVGAPACFPMVSRSRGQLVADGRDVALEQHLQLLQLVGRHLANIEARAGALDDVQQIAMVHAASPHSISITVG